MHEGRLLLVCRRVDPWRGHWDVPGGFCERGEHPMFTAVRELMEETGLAVEIVGFLGMWPDDYVDANGTSKATINIYYHAIPRRGESVPRAFESAEVSELGWFAPWELPSPETLAFPAHLVPMLAAWRRALEAGAIRTPLWDVPRGVPAPGT